MGRDDVTFRFCSPHSIKLVYIENTLLRNDGASATLSGRSVAKHSSPMNATRLDVVKLTPVDHRERYIVSSRPACRSHFTSWQPVPARQSIEAKRRLSSQVRTNASTGNTASPSTSCSRGNDPVQRCGFAEAVAQLEDPPTMVPQSFHNGSLKSLASQACEQSPTFHRVPDEKYTRGHDRLDVPHKRLPCALRATLVAQTDGLDLLDVSAAAAVSQTRQYPPLAIPS